MNEIDGGKLSRTQASDWTTPINVRECIDRYDRGGAWMRVVMVVIGALYRLVCMALITIDRCGGRYDVRFPSLVTSRFIDEA